MVLNRLRWAFFLSLYVAHCERNLMQGIPSETSHELLHEAKVYAEANLSRAINSTEVNFFPNQSTLSDYDNPSCPDIVVIPSLCQSTPDKSQASVKTTAFPFVVRNVTTDGLDLFYLLGAYYEVLAIWQPSR
ncbi:g13331 [Coccomyxa viridis]|uniref:G13331 protein n=1 Tax=Coccomyxa viridis TaxID=1274662 RepID=A0ABP1GCH4_9CHLO